MVIIVEFHDGTKQNHLLEIESETYCMNDIYRSLNTKYRTKWKDFKFLNNENVNKA